MPPPPLCDPYFPSTRFPRLREHTVGRPVELVPLQTLLRAGDLDAFLEKHREKRHVKKSQKTLSSFRAEFRIGQGLGGQKRHYDSWPLTN